MTYLAEERPLPTHSSPTNEDWVPVTTSGEWYWEGSAWRRTAVSPWSTRGHPPHHRGYPGTLASALLAVPVFVAGLVAEILGRGLSAAVRVIVGVFAVAAVVALAVLLIAAFLRG